MIDAAGAPLYDPSIVGTTTPVGVFTPLAAGTAVTVSAFRHLPERPHRDPDLERFDDVHVVLTTAGRWRFRSARGEGEIARHSIVAGAPGDEFTCGHEERVPTDETLDLRFAGSELSRLGLGAEPLFRRSVVDHTRRSGELARALVEECAHPGRPLRALALDLLALELLVETARTGGDERPVSAARRRMRAVAEYVDAHLERDLTAAELAAVAYVSPWHLTRLFRRELGETPRQYVIRRRIERAVELLAEGGLTVDEVRARVGFGSPSHFAATVRRLTGRPPSAHRAGSRYRKAENRRP